ncbi:MAG: hypothetical protein AAGF92_01360 [Myxococcota bacterium]
MDHRVRRRLIPRRVERLSSVITLFVVGTTCLDVGGWFFYRVGSGESEGPYVPAALCVAFAFRAARRR